MPHFAICCRRTISQLRATRQVRGALSAMAFVIRAGASCYRKPLDAAEYSSWSVETVLVLPPQMPSDVFSTPHGSWVRRVLECPFRVCLGAVGPRCCAHGAILAAGAPDFV